MNQVPFVACSAADKSTSAAYAQSYGLTFTSGSPSVGLVLVYEQDILRLRNLDEPKQGDVYVDWTGGASAHRRRFGGGKGQSIAKAVGLNKGGTPHVADATAGLGRDAFVLASLGCHVDLIERSPTAYALLQDGYRRACADAEIGQWIAQRMTLHFGPAWEQLAALATQPEVVYLDPMFPHRQKSALVKKEMRVFQQLVGTDEDADKLLDAALQAATKRVAVKRPSSAPFLAQRQPHTQITSKKHRYDIYIP